MIVLRGQLGRGLIEAIALCWNSRPPTPASVPIGRRWTCK